MNIQEIDGALQAWNNRLATAAQNLMDLQSHPAYEQLTIASGSLQGKTAVQAALAVNTLKVLLQYYELLQGTISRAEELRRDLPVFFGSEGRLQAIEQLLNTRSVYLPTAPVPLGQRGLLSGVENVDCIAPATLLNTMAKAFEEAKAIVLSIDAAWQALGQSARAAGKRIEALQRDSELVGETERVQLREAEAQLHGLRQAAAYDPLGTGGELAGEVTFKLDALAEKIAQRKQLREQVQADLRSAEALWTSVQSSHREACGAYAEACEKVTAAAGFPSPKPDEEVEALGAWLGRLQGKCGEGALEAARIGLRNWTNAARNMLGSDRAVADGSRQLLETRSELRGRLDALKAKARAYSIAEEKGLLALGEQARNVLYSRPSALDRAASLVSEYERKLNLLAGKSVRK